MPLSLALALAVPLGLEPSVELVIVQMLALLAARRRLDSVVHAHLCRFSGAVVRRRNASTKGVARERLKRPQTKVAVMRMRLCKAKQWRQRWW